MTPPSIFSRFLEDRREALGKFQKNWGAAGAAGEKMVAPQAPLSKNSGAAGATE